MILQNNVFNHLWGETVNKVVEKLKDILYDSFDYVIIIGIVAIVAVIIGWRLDILFADDVVNKQEETQVVHTDPKRPEEISSSDEPLENEEGPNDDVDTDGEEAVAEGESEILIPPGALPGDIASLLEENKLIDNRQVFLDKVIESNLETKLKAGTYSIPPGSSYEEVLDILIK